MIPRVAWIALVLCMKHVYVDGLVERSQICPIGIVKTFVGSKLELLSEPSRRGSSHFIMWGPRPSISFGYLARRSLTQEGNRLGA